jgi:glycosyltransferase involved in cell wall biosynthesis
VKILFLTRSLNIGGTERQLVELSKGLCRKGHDIKVVEFYSGGVLEEGLRAGGVPLYSLQKKGRWDLLLFFFRLLRYVRQERPQIIYSFLGIPCILAVFLKLFQSGVRIVWGVRAAYVDLRQYDFLSRFAYKWECRLARFADLIIVNSFAGRKYARKHGFPKRISVIPNGIDVTYFSPNRFARQEIRNTWEVNNEEVLVGLIGRLDPMKDFSNFLAAASQVATEFSQAKFVCVGHGFGALSSDLGSAAKKFGLDNKMIFADEQNQMPRIYSSIDLLVSSSYGEGFSNVIAEAMACGVPCVVTDVGDSAKIVGETGIVVPPKNPKALARGIIAMVRRPDFLDESLKIACRDRIVTNFNLDRLIDRTVSLLDGLRCSN